jgi:hypothetical protein
MRVESQVCTLIQAKRLKELYVLQGTYWIWRQEVLYPENIPVLITVGQLPTGIDKDAFNLYSAFTVAELSVMLLEYAETYFSKNGTWRIEGSDLDFDTQAEASADRLIRLIENNILDINEVNNRLTK